MEQEKYGRILVQQKQNEPRSDNIELLVLTEYGLSLFGRLAWSSLARVTYLSSGVSCCKRDLISNLEDSGLR